MLHIGYLNKLKYEINNINDIYLGLCCVICFKGHVIHAQVMTPGIIFNSEHLIQYGEFDESKIRNDPEFQAQISPLMSEKLQISSNTIELEDSTRIENYLGHPEIKGVRGVDKRKYLFDLVHLFPRDLNFDSPGALLRPEVIQEYKLKLLQEVLQKPENKEKLSAIQQEIEKISKNSKDNETLVKELEVQMRKRDQLYEEKSNEVRDSFRLNTVYGTEYKVVAPSEQEIAALKSLAKFLKEDLIGKFLSEMENDEETLPCDSDTLHNVIHRYGISTKYFGYMISQIENSESMRLSLSWLKSLIQREIIIKSARSIYNEAVKAVPNYLVKSFTAYFLNVLLGSPGLVKAIEYFNIRLDTDGNMSFAKPEENEKKEKEQRPIATQHVQKVNKESDKKKKKRKKKGNKGFDTDIKFYLTENLVGSKLSNIFQSSDEQLFLKPSQVVLLYLDLGQDSRDFQDQVLLRAHSHQRLRICRILFQ